jgi:uncharacterized protein (DUF4415 family)
MKKKKPDHISQEDWDAVDVPEWTEEMFRRARPASEVFPGVVFPKPMVRGPQKAPTKVQTTFRIDRDVIEHFRSAGRGWQTHVNDVLRQAARREKKRAKS